MLRKCKRESSILQNVFGFFRFFPVLLVQTGGKMQEPMQNDPRGPGKEQLAQNEFPHLPATQLPPNGHEGPEAWGKQQRHHAQDEGLLARKA